jgi:predicted transcriptional regulator
MPPQQWANEHLGGYIKMELDDRREIVRELADDGMSQRQISVVLGVAQSTVSEDRNRSKTNGKESDSDRKRTPEIVARAIQDAYNDAQAEKSISCERNNCVVGKSVPSQNPPFENRWLSGCRRSGADHARSKTSTLGSYSQTAIANLCSGKPFKSSHLWLAFRFAFRIARF